MKKIWIWLLVLLGVLVLAAAAFTYHMSTKEEPEEEPVFNAVEACSLPLISTELEGQQIDVLHGYAEERDLATTELPLIPLDNSILKLKVSLYGNTLEKFTYVILERDSGTLISEGEFSDWENDSDTVNCTMSLGSLVTSDTEYRLNLKLELANGKTVYYYAGICDAEATLAKEMLAYVMEFHEDLYIWDQAKTHESNLEIKSGYDQKTLQNVSIYSSLSQLAWGNMKVEEVPNTLNLTVLELDGSFGSFQLEYEVESGDPLERYVVKEYFCVHNGLKKLYLMDYRRTATALISGHDERYSQGYVDFGIVDPNEVELAESEDKSLIVFQVADEIYRYRPDSGEMIEVFTFRDEDDQARSGYRRYGTKILNVDDNGDVSFLVYGYMNRGAHEGQVGVSCMTYLEKSHSLMETFFLPYGGSVEELEQSVEQLAYMSADGQVYVLVGDVVYDVDTANKVMNVVVDNAREKGLATNEAHTAIVWKTDTEQQHNRSVQIMYLDTGETQTVNAPNGDWVSPCGFIEDDCILSYGHSGEVAEVDGERVDPAYALVVLNREGKEEVRYEYPSIYISSAVVKDGQIVMGRLSGDGNGNYSQTTDDILMQSSGSVDEEKLTLTAVSEELRMRVYRLSNVGDPKNPKVIRIRTPKGINYETSEALALETVPAINGDGMYYAYAEGEFCGTYRTAGEAITNVFDGMGIVMDSNGRVVWRRSGRASQISMKPEELLTGTGNDGRNACLTMMAQIAGQNGFMIQASADTSAMEAVESIFPGRALNLTGASVKALMYYLNKGVPLLVVDKYEKATLILGYDQFNVEVYDPSTGEKFRQGQGDTDNLLEDGCSCIGFVPN